MYQYTDCTIHYNTCIHVHLQKMLWSKRFKSSNIIVTLIKATKCPILNTHTADYEEKVMKLYRLFTRFVVGVGVGRQQL